MPRIFVGIDCVDSTMTADEIITCGAANCIAVGGINTFTKKRVLAHYDTRRCIEYELDIKELQDFARWLTLKVDPESSTNEKYFEVGFGSLWAGGKIGTVSTETMALTLESIFRCTVHRNDFSGTWLYDGDGILWPWKEPPGAGAHAYDGEAIPQKNQYFGTGTCIIS